MISKAIVGGGCFWCVEAVLQRLKGVSKVESGYAGGHLPNPTYKDICTGQSGHAEVIRVHFDSKIMSYHELLYIFMHTHDPTTLNRQGNDSGTQYRSVIFYETEEEQKTALELIKEIQPNFKSAIVTQVDKLDKFYLAEADHQNFYNENKTNGYCKVVVRPKVDKLTQMFEKYLDQAKL